MDKAIRAAQAAIDAHEADMGLEPNSARSTQLWHLVASLLEWCDAHHLDFDATVSTVRADFAAMGEALAQPEKEF